MLSQFSEMTASQPSSLSSDFWLITSPHLPKGLKPAEGKPLKSPATILPAPSESSVPPQQLLKGSFPSTFKTSQMSFILKIISHWYFSSLRSSVFHSQIPQKCHSPFSLLSQPGPTSAIMTTTLNPNNILQAPLPSQAQVSLPPGGGHFLLDFFFF